MQALVERDADTSALAALLDNALAGRGGNAVILGPAGIGKSALLATIPGSALRAAGGELEQEFPYGVMRQLFEGVVRRLAPVARRAVLSGPARHVAALLIDGATPAAVGDGFALEHGFYWLASHLAEQDPLVLVVDDLHWTDVASLRSLLYLARRLSDLPIALVLASRPVTDARAPVVERLVAEAALVLEPAPLSLPGAGSLVHRTLAEADKSFCDACHAASGGNPFLLSELVSAVRASGVEPVEANAGRVRSIGAQSVMRSVVLRLGGLSGEAFAVGRTLAVAGESHPIELIAELTELPVRAAIAATDELRLAHILEANEPRRFVHSIVRDAVYSDVPLAERSRLHRAAAAALADSGAPVDAVASHLLLTTPGADAWTFQRLITAASSPAARAAPETSATYLGRALRESVAGVDRAPLLLALGAVRFQMVGQDAVGPLSQARELADDRVVRLEATRALASAYMTEMRFAESWELVEAGIADFADLPDMASDLEIFSAQSLYTEVDADRLALLSSRVRAWQPDPGGAGVRDRSMLATQAWLSASTAEPASRSAALARAALSTDSLVTDDIYYVSIDLALWSLIASSCYGQAQRHADSAIEACLSAGRLLRAATLMPIRAELQRRLGKLPEGMDDARFAYDLIPPEQIYAPQAAAAYVLALVETNDVSTAGKVMTDRGYDSAIPAGGIGDPLWFARGRLKVAEGDLTGGVEDLMTFGALCDRMNRVNPGLYPWRSTAVGPLLQLGRPEEAASLAEQELALAGQTGVPEQIARARFAVGLVRGVDAATELDEAEAALAASRFSLDAAYAALSLGGLLRRAGKRELARQRLRTAADLAARIGAVGVAEAARAELVAAGARPRRAATSGVGALTASESRVASLAAEGLTNREIAHALYVTPKTIETHLASAYRKLGITGKGELPKVLAAG